MPMKAICDTCGRTATGSMDDLIDEGWCRIVISTPIRKTFTGCPDHAHNRAEAAMAAIVGTQRGSKK